MTQAAILLALLALLAAPAQGVNVWGPGDPVDAYYANDSGLAYIFWGCSFSGGVQIAFKVHEPDGKPVYVELREYTQDPRQAGTFDGIPFNTLYTGQVQTAYNSWVTINTQDLAAGNYYVLIIIGTDTSGAPLLTEQIQYKIATQDSYSNLEVLRIVDYGNDGTWEPQATSYADPVFTVTAGTVDCSGSVELRIVSVEQAAGGVKVRFYLDGLPQGAAFHAHIVADQDGDGVLEVVSRDSLLFYAGTGVYEIIVKEITVTPWHLRVVWSEGGNTFEKLSEARRDVYISGWIGVRTLINLIMSIAPIAVKSTVIFVPYAGVIWSLWLLSSLIRSIQELSVQPIVDFFYKNFSIVMGVFDIAKTAVEATASLATKAVDLIKTLIDVIL